MRLRGPISLSTAAVAILALSLGSVGTATAGGLTKGAVKKIATKVVTKKASGLSVAHAVSAASATTATSAGNATTLAGQPASAYQDTATHYTYLMPAAADTFLTPLPVGPGTYSVSFAVVLVGSATDTATCELLTFDASSHLGGIFGASTGPLSNAAGTGLSGADSAVVHPGDTLYLGCGSVANTSFSMISGAPTSITVTPLDSLGDGGALPSSVSSRALAALAQSLR